MKEKLLIGFAALVLALVAAFNINLNTKDNTLSSLSLANVEALAQNEGSGGAGTQHDHFCYGGSTACVIINDKMYYKN